MTVLEIIGIILAMIGLLYGSVKALFCLIPIVCDDKAWALTLALVLVAILLTGIIVGLMSILNLLGVFVDAS